MSALPLLDSTAAASPRPRHDTFISGLEALKQILLLQRECDRRRGLNTSGYVSGYRGSPLGGLDQLLARSSVELAASQIVFQPGLNEDLAATAVWGTQQTHLFPGATRDGVFSLWYSKGPGVDRSIDALKHGNAAGTHRNGGVLLAVGDDHGAASSSLPHQSEPVLTAAGIPVLVPGSVADIVRLGLVGIAMSRSTGVWVALKLVADIVESVGSVDLPSLLADPVTLPVHEGPSLGICWPDSPLAQEARLMDLRLPAVTEFARLNRLDEVTVRPSSPMIAMIASGKSYGDLLEAFELLGWSRDRLVALGVRVGKIGLAWPLDEKFLLGMAEDCAELVVVEEKRPFLEDQARAILQRGKRTLDVSGKRDPAGHALFRATGTHDAVHVAMGVARRILQHRPDAAIARRLAALEEQLRAPASIRSGKRTPYFCPGCPHNSSTRTPAGTRALAGIGCHYMAMWMDRAGPFTHMGAEGANWLGLAPFTRESHVFVNLGDGTYAHSGVLAIRAAVAAGVNVTYKILYNGAVAMTGGQPVEGSFSVLDIVRQTQAERVAQVVVVAAEPERYESLRAALNGVRVYHRRELDSVQRQLAKTAGVTVVIYDQQCATERRRERKRGLAAPAPRRVVINERVCEGCGDCGKASNCLAVEPVPSAFGTKRRINQSACNQDLACVAGFCPSFVTVEGARPTKPTLPEAWLEAMKALPVSSAATLEEGCDIAVAGVGGSGVVTIANVLGLAAHEAGLHASTLNQTGLAQKGGAVLGHVRVSREALQNRSTRVNPQRLQVLIACDVLVALEQESVIRHARGVRIASNLHVASDAATAFDPNSRLDHGPARARLAALAECGNLSEVDATGLAERAFGDAIYANLILVGQACERGWLPFDSSAVEAGIRKLAVAVEENLRAFRLGRLAVRGLPEVDATQVAASQTQSVAQRMEFFANELRHYQDERYAQRYLSLLAKVESVSADDAERHQALRLAIAENLFKVMAYKDEYEVARLYAEPGFWQDLRRQFGAGARPTFHFAPPLLGFIRDSNGQPRKLRFGGGMKWLFKLLASMRFLRGTALDPFGWTSERRDERRFAADYVRWIEQELAGSSDAAALERAIAVARIPETVRGYGHVKRRSLQQAYSRHAQLTAS